MRDGVRCSHKITRPAFLADEWKITNAMVYNLFWREELAARLWLGEKRWNWTRLVADILTLRRYVPYIA